MEVTYSSTSEIRKPIKLVKSMFKDLWKSRDLALNLMKRDISVQYRQSFLGFGWAFIPSIVTAITFTVATKNKVLNLSETDIPYPVFVIFGVTLWQTFSEAVMGPVTGLTSAKAFIAKIKFQHEALFVAKLGEACFNFLIKSILIIAIFSLYGVTPSIYVFLALPMLFCMIVLGQSIGLLLAPINIIYQDIGKGLPLVLGLGLFVTPIVYPIPVGDSYFATIVKMNPLTYLINGIRDLTVKGYTLYGNEILIVAVASLIVFFFSWLVFRLSMPSIIERCP